MGNSIPFSKYASGFAEVADKTKWRVGLTVNVCGCGEVVVKSIRGLKMGPDNGTLTVGEDINRIFHYYYAGDQITINDSAKYDVYEIMLVEKHISDANPGCSWGGTETNGSGIEINGGEDEMDEPDSNKQETGPDESDYNDVSEENIAGALQFGGGYIGGCENCKNTSCEHCTGGCDCATGGCPFCGKHQEEIVI